MNNETAMQYEIQNLRSDLAIVVAALERIIQDSHQPYSNESPNSIATEALSKIRGDK